MKGISMKGINMGGGIKVRDLMLDQPIFIPPDTTLREAAFRMRDADCGVLPVGTPEKLEGIITDRDLVTRALINGEHASKPVSGYMTPQIVFCYDDDKLTDAANLMQKSKLNRLVVKDHESDRIVGILSFSDILRHKATGKDIAKIVERCCHKKSA